MAEYRSRTNTSYFWLGNGRDELPLVRDKAQAAARPLLGELKAYWLLSRRDSRTQPGVSTPGSDAKKVRPNGAVEPDSRYELNPGLKPRAESLNPFGINFGTPFWNPAVAGKRQ